MRYHTALLWLTSELHRSGARKARGRSAHTHSEIHRGLRTLNPRWTRTLSGPVTQLAASPRRSAFTAPADRPPARRKAPQTGHGLQAQNPKARSRGARSLPPELEAGSRSGGEDLGAPASRDATAGRAAASRREPCATHGRRRAERVDRGGIMCRLPTGGVGAIPECRNRLARRREPSQRDREHWTASQTFEEALSRAREEPAGCQVSYFCRRAHARAWSGRVGCPLGHQVRRLAVLRPGAWTAAMMKRRP